MKEIRVEARIKNNILWHAIYDQWGSVAEFCRQKKLNQVLVGEFLNLKRSPFNKSGTYSNPARKCADALGVEPVQLFPSRLYQQSVKGKVFLEYSFSELPEVETQLLLTSAPEDPFSDVAAHELAQNLEVCLGTLTPRQERVIRSYYGIGCPPKTSSEIGAEMGVELGRVIQILREGLMGLGAQPRTDYEYKYVGTHGGLRRKNVEKLKDLI